VFLKFEIIKRLFRTEDLYFLKFEKDFLNIDFLNLILKLVDWNYYMGVKWLIQLFETAK
jgi:hypothetical protein